MKLHRDTTRLGVLALGLTAMIFGASCDRAEGGPKKLPAPAVDLEQSGTEATAVVAGGCFWCVEAALEQLEGVTDVVSGYTGGSEETADYKTVCSGTTDHAEAVKVTYDPSKISYGTLLRAFFTAHNPTQLNRQGNDYGRQYRSAIFFASDEEKLVAEAYIKQLNDSGAFPAGDAFGGPVVTTLEPLETFYLAEGYHQDYARLNPYQPYIVGVSLPKVKKVRDAFPELIEGE
ncbi:MAG: peptide-methionine (S)-S-oxide reductase MsrA [Planctomycetota bacterium]